MVEDEPRRRVECMHIAALNGHAELIKMLVNTYGFDPNTNDGEMQSPLAWAAKKGHVLTAKVCLSSIYCTWLGKQVFKSQFAEKRVSCLYM